MVFLENSQNSQEKTCARDSFLITLQAKDSLIKFHCLRPATLLKKSLWHRCFAVNFVKLLRTPFLTEQLRSVLLKIFTFAKDRIKRLTCRQELLIDSSKS